MSAYTDDDVQAVAAVILSGRIVTRPEWARREARAVLEFIAPAIAARAWDEGHEAGIAAEHDGFPTEQNPYDEIERGAS